MIQRTHGSMTPKDLADTLSRRCHLVAITPDSRYYTGDIGKGRRGYRVIYVGEIPCQVIELPAEDVERYH